MKVVRTKYYEQFFIGSKIAGITPFENKIWLSSPTMHGEEQAWINDAFEKNWITTIGENINTIEQQLAKKIGRKVKDLNLIFPLNWLLLTASIILSAFIFIKYQFSNVYMY